VRRNPDFIRVPCWVFVRKGNAPMWNWILAGICILIGIFGGPTMARALGSGPGTGHYAAIVLAVVLFFALKSK